MVFSFVITTFLLLLVFKLAYSLMVRKEYISLVIFLLVLRIVYIKESKSKYERTKTINDKSVVESWMLNEVKITRDKLNDFQSAGVCVKEQLLAVCVNDILSNLQPTNDKATHFKKILHFTSNEAFSDHLAEISQKTKKQLALLEWLKQTHLLSIEAAYLLNKYSVQTLKDLSELRLKPVKHGYDKVSTVKSYNNIRSSDITLKFVIVNNKYIWNLTLR